MKMRRRIGHFSAFTAPASSEPERGLDIRHLSPVFLFQERNDDGDSLLGLFLHDPVP